MPRPTTNPPLALLAPLLLVGVVGIAQAQPVEVMLRDASCYPDQACTSGRPEMPAFRHGPGGGAYGLTATPLSLSHPTRLTRTAGVGFEPNGVPFEWVSMIWTLNVWAATDDQAARELFAQSPKHGNIIDDAPLLELHEPLGATDYWVTLTPTSVLTLAAGDYLVSVSAFSTNVVMGIWCWRESSVDLGTDLYADSWAPGQSFEYATDFGHLGYTTGTSALDIWGYEITCPGDFNFDGFINQSDLGVLLANYDSTDATYEEGDLDLDGDVDQADLGALLAVYDTDCP